MNSPKDFNAAAWRISGEKLKKILQNRKRRKETMNIKKRLLNIWSALTALRYLRPWCRRNLNLSLRTQSRMR